MPYFIHNNETLKNATYALDEHAFFNCKLTNCTLVYSGGSFEFVNLQLENCQWKFRNDANLIRPFGPCTILARSMSATSPGSRTRNSPLPSLSRACGTRRSSIR